MNRRQKIIVSVTGIFLVLLLLVGLTYAYFLTRINGNENTKSISVSTANLALVYGNDDGSVIGEGETIEPGKTFEPKTFTVTNQGNANTDYVVVIENTSVTYSTTVEVDGETHTAGDTTTFESNDFTYTLTCESGCDGVNTATTFPIEGGILVGNRIDVGETQTYSFTLTYNETGIDQSNDMNKKLEAKINIKDITKDNPYSDNTDSLAYNIINNAVALTNEEKTLGYAELVGSPYTKAGEEISETKALTGYEVPLDKTISVNTTYQGYYWTYATSYSIDPETGLFSLVNPQVCLYSDSNCISDLITTGENIYIVSATTSLASSSTEELQTTTELDYVYRVVSAPTASDVDITITIRRITNQPESVLSAIQDEYGTSYYYRGAVKNNYLEFNRMCWRIVRIEGDGSVKITLAAQKNCSEITTEDESSAFIGTGDYGYTDDLRADYENNTNRATSMKYKFNAFLKGGSFESYDEDENIITKEYAGFSEESIDLLKNEEVCIGDIESAYTSAGILMTEAEKQEAITNYSSFYYKNYIRIYKNKIVSLMCDINGNKTKETQIYPLTIDEVILAGGIFDTSNFSYYLRENASSNSWWTLSMSGFSYSNERAFIVIKNGRADYYSVNHDDVSLRPTVSLVTGIEINGGDGTQFNPYVVG